MEDLSHEDVVMGDGLAGLSPAVQLERCDPGNDVLLAELAPHPPPAAAHEIGASTVEAAAHHSRELLGLEACLSAEQLPTAPAERAPGQAEASRGAIPPSCPPR